MSPQHSEPGANHASTVHAPRFDVLLVGHDPAGSAEATLVLGAIAAINGLRADGEPMQGRCGDGSAFAGRPGTLAQIAHELGLHVGAVRRGVEELHAAGAVRRTADGIEAVAAALAGRWQGFRHRVRLPATARRLHLRAEPLLVAGIVHGQTDQRGRCVLGLPYLMERTGLARRTLQRALATAEEAGALHRWTAPIGRGQLVIAPGPRIASAETSQSGAREAAQSGAREGVGDGAAPLTIAKRRTFPSQSGAPTVAKRRTSPREAAHLASQSGARHPDCPPDVLPDSPPDASAQAPAQTPAPPSGETREAPAADPAAAAAAAAAAPAPKVPAICEAWVTAFARRGIERLTDQHVPDVAGLLASLGPPPDVRDRDPDRAARRRAELHRDRAALARRVIAWCPSPERLGRWIVRVARRYRVGNPTGYLRRAVERGGDPGCVLESAQKTATGRAAEGWQDFSPRTERAIEGDHVRDVQRLVAGGVAVLAAPSDLDRELARKLLQKLLVVGNLSGAGTVLRKVLGTQPSDVDLGRFCAGICDLQRAREALAA